MTSCRAAVQIVLLFLVWSLAPLAQAQVAQLEQDWRVAKSPHFVVFSQVSGSRTERFMRELETWRMAAGALIADGRQLPLAAVKNTVFLFADADAFQAFALARERAFFYPTPRRNFMALVYGDPASLTEARHHYVHFLMRNFTDLRIPRWYEEGMAGYLAGLQVERGRVELEPYGAPAFEASLRVNGEVSVGELIFDESSLASPRLIQIANLKAETLLHFLLHGHEEDGWADRRPQLQAYLSLSLAGREQRFAFDQAFDVTPMQLDADYARYLVTSRRPRGHLDLPDYRAASDAVQVVQEPADWFVLANALGELALNAGKFELSQGFYQVAMERGSPLGRSYSGYADALRMQDIELDYQGLRSYYQRAVEVSPAEPEVLLDFGEYLESLFHNCERPVENTALEALQAEILSLFSRVIQLAPDMPEANLAMGQFHLLPGQDHSRGREFQRRALTLLPADTFIMEQTIKYEIEAGAFEEARRLTGELAQPLHFWGEPAWITDLRTRLQHKQQGVPYDPCEHAVGA